MLNTTSHDSTCISGSNVDEHGDDHMHASSDIGHESLAAESTSPTGT